MTESEEWQREFNLLDNKTRSGTQELFRREEHKPFNFYTNIGGHDHAQVWANANRDGDYYNASWIDGRRMVVAQAPQESGRLRFLLMLANNDIRSVFMLTTLIDCFGRRKCSPYIPEQMTNHFGPEAAFEWMKEKVFHPLHNVDSSGAVPVTVSPKKREERHEGELIITTLEINVGTGPPKPLTHYWFRGWPDGGVPRSADAVLELARLMLDEPGPPLVHCSAGAGRAGVLALLVTLMRRRRSGDTFTGRGALKVLDELREDRPDLVQTFPQFLFAFRAFETWEAQEF